MVLPPDEQGTGARTGRAEERLSDARGGASEGQETRRDSANDDGASESGATRQYFPETQHQWIRERIDRGSTGHGEISEHIMQLYYRPLQYYYLGLRGLRNLGEPEDIISGFFADRLARRDFYAKWERSGLKLRRWLMNGLHFYLKERIRAENRNRKRGDVESLQLAFEEDPKIDEFDRGFATSLVTEALKRVKAGCLEKGLGDHWEIFFRHHYHGESYLDFAHEYDIKPVRASVMARTVRDRFRTTIQRLLIDDGVAPKDVGPEIQALLETMTR